MTDQRRLLRRTLMQSTRTLKSWKMTWRVLIESLKGEIRCITTDLFDCNMKFDNLSSESVKRITTIECLSLKSRNSRGHFRVIIFEELEVTRRTRDLVDDWVASVLAVDQKLDRIDKFKAWIIKHRKRVYQATTQDTVTLKIQKEADQRLWLKLR